MAAHGRKGFTLVELMIVVAIIGALAAIAIPNYLKFQGRAKTTEAKVNLRAIFTAQHTHFQEHDSYSRSVSQISFVPERNNRYSYDLDPDVTRRFNRLSNAREQLAGNETGFTSDQAKGYVPLTPNPAIALVIGGANGAFTATAVGNADHDSAPDQWSIASASRGAGDRSGTSSTTALVDGSGICDSGVASAGEPCHDVVDL